MIVILSPSKTLGKIETKGLSNISKPMFLEQSQVLIEQLRKLSVENLKSLMNISESLARLNYERFLRWHTPFNSENSYPALLFFKGDVYEGITASDFTNDDFAFAQNNLRILSGLYGALRPLDLMQPYRLEMGTKIEIEGNQNLYEFWQETITEYFNALLKDDKEQIVVNLASIEYSKSINFKLLSGNVITPIFKEQKGNTYKTIAIHAKRARGLMTRFIIKNKLEEVKHLETFSDEGYLFSSELSRKNELVFIR